jgi:hypothetical protein
MECHPKYILHSQKQHMFLVVFELSGPSGVAHEVVLYWEQTDLQAVNSKGSSVKGFPLYDMYPITLSNCPLKTFYMIV